MAFKLSRNQALTVRQLSIYGTASLLSREGEEIKVPLAPLLGASSLVRSIVAESRLHPGLHGPLALSFTVGADILVSVGDILGAGESNVKDGNIEEVTQVFGLLGLEGNLSRIRKNILYEHIVANEEKVPGPVSDEKSDISDGDIEETEDDLLKECHILYGRIVTNEEDAIQEKVPEPVSDAKAKFSYGDTDETYDDSLKECYVNIENIGVRRPADQSYCNRTSKNVRKRRKVKKCYICGHSSTDARNLEIHMRIHRGEKPYKCPLCNYSSSFPGALKRHSRTHTGEKPFKCSTCTYSCSEPASLKKHNRIHTGEKPFKCKVCTYSCSTLSALKVHNRIHTGEKPYTCNICNKSFSQFINLESHNRMHTGEKPFKCKVCTYSCSNLSGLKVHNRIHTGEKPYTCEICDESFCQFIHLRRHGKIHTENKN